MILDPTSSSIVHGLRFHTCYEHNLPLKAGQITVIDNDLRHIRESLVLPILNSKLARVKIKTETKTSICNEYGVV